MKGTFRNGSRRLGILLALFLWLGCLFCSTAWAAPKAVVAHSEGGISFVDLATKPPTLTGPLLADYFGDGNNIEVLDVVVTLDKKYVFVSQYNASMLYRINITDPEHLLVDELEMGMKPEDIALSPDGNLAIVTDGAGVQPVVLVDVADFKILGSYTPVSAKAKVRAVAIARDNQTVLMADYESNRILVAKINAQRNNLVDEEPLVLPLAGPRNIAISPDGKTVLVVGDDGIVSCEINEPGVLSGAFTVVAGAPVKGQSVAFAPDGKKAYSYHQAYTINKSQPPVPPKMVVLTVDPVSGVQIEAQFELPAPPLSDYYGTDTIAVSPDGRYVIATNAGIESIAVFDLSVTPLEPSYISLSGNSALTVEASSKPAPTADPLAGVAFIPMIPPTFKNEAQDLTASVGEPFTLDFTADNATSYAITISRDGTGVLPSWATFDPTARTLSGTPDKAGTIEDITITATNEDGTATLGPFTVTVTDPNQPPTIALPADASTTAYVGAPYTLALSFSDPNPQDILAFTKEAGPPELQVDPKLGVITWTPAAGDYGWHHVIIKVDDDRLSATVEFDLIVPNRAPTLTGTPSSQVLVGSPYRFVPEYKDDDHDTPIFSIANKPSWAQFDENSGVLYGTPLAEHAGPYSGITITVKDGYGEGRASASIGPFSIKVTIPNRPPKITNAPQTAVEVFAKQGYSFTPAVSDEDQDSLKVTVTAPGWLTYNQLTGILSGTPTWKEVGTSSTVVISVTDDKSPPVTASFTITVPNRAPVISGTPVTSVAAGTSYTFTPTASDPDGAPLTFCLESTIPNWATFNASTGTISGSPPKGSYSISISVSDGKEKVYLRTFVIDALPSCYQMTAIWMPSTNSTGSFTVSWQNNMSGVVYVLEQSVDGGSYEQIYSGTEPRRTVKVESNGNYSYRVRATKPGYIDSAPLEVKAPCVVFLQCTAPPFIRVPQTSLTGGYTVSWDGTPISSVIYELEESTDGVNFSRVYSGTAASAVLIRGNGSYYYRVRATKNGYEESPYKAGANPTVVTIR